MTLSPTPLRHPLKWSRPLVGRGSPSTHGWIIDAYGDYDRDSMVLWLWNEQGAHRIEDPGFLPTFFLHAPPAELPALRRRIEILDGVREVREVERRIALEDEEPRPVLEIVPRHYRDLPKVARILDSNGGYVDHKLFNVDLRPSQRYMMEHGIFPMGLVRHANGRWTPEEEHFALDYPLPPLRRSLLDLHVDNPMGIPRMQDRLLGARVDEDEVDGDEESILRGIEELVRTKDPDVLLTDGGGAFTMPFLARRATELGVDLQLGRDRDRFTEKKGKSYFTYGKIVYKPGQYLLRGRLHLDRGHFAYRESALAGLAELSRLSTLTPPEQARPTPGTAFTAMQVNLAHKDGTLVLWKKNRPEGFKSAEDLLRGDRGGFIFEPEVGLHEGLYELDFFALYPSIMVGCNISAETLDCPCCTLDGRAVPELRYHFCRRRLGLIPRVLKPVLERRRYYKKMKREPGPLQEIYVGRDTILKWLLVTCLDGHTRVPYQIGREFRIDEIQNVVDSHFSGTGSGPAPDGFRALGLGPAMRPVDVPVRRFFRFEAPEAMVGVRFSNDDEVLFTEDHPCYVIRGGRFELKQASQLEPGDCVPLLGDPRVNGESPGLSTARVERVRKTRPQSDFVYCFKVGGAWPGFAIEGGIWTHNCFRIHRVLQRPLRPHRVPRSDQRVRAGHPRSHDGDRRIPWLQGRPWHRGLRLASAEARHGSHREGPRTHRGFHRPADRTRGPLQMDCLPPVQDDGRRRAQPLLRLLRERRVQAARDRAPQARHPGVHQHRPGGDARGAEPRVHRGGVPRTHPACDRRPPLDREARPRPRDPRARVHPHEERLPRSPGVRRPDGDGRGAQADGETRLQGRAGG